MELVGRLLHQAIHPGCSNNCVGAAYLQFAKPDIPQVIEEAVFSGAQKIVIHPYFLTSGMHVTKDIPAIVAEARQMYPDREFILTEPLGIHDKLVKLVVERISAAKGLSPAEIEKHSFEIISEETDLSGLPLEHKPIVERVIHATADFEFKTSLMFHAQAIAAGIAAIRAGKDILTDVEMVKTGINKKLLAPWGGKVICNIGSQPNPAHEAALTRAQMGIEAALTQMNNIGVVAIGNAPTALIKVIELVNKGGAGSDRPALVIGVPVGFVKALEAKTLLSAQQFPFITNISRKGGTAVAVAIVNALLRMAGENE